MSTIGPKQTSLAALHMSAFGGKAGMVTILVSAVYEIFGAGLALASSDVQLRGVSFPFVT